jgi:hypothetical protein
MPILDPTGGAGNLGGRSTLFPPGGGIVSGLEGTGFALQYEGTGFSGMGLPLSGYTGPPAILPIGTSRVIYDLRNDALVTNATKAIAPKASNPTPDYAWIVALLALLYFGS